MDAWAIHSHTGESANPLDDPQQRIRPIIAGPAIAWLAADGQVASYPAADFETKIIDNGFKTLITVPGPGSSHYSPDYRRVVLVMLDVDPETGPAMALSDPLTTGAAGTLGDLARSAAGMRTQAPTAVAS